MILRWLRAPGFSVQGRKKEEGDYQKVLLLCTDPFTKEAKCFLVIVHHSPFTPQKEESWSEL
jgi:hypothetical protein